MQDKNTTVSTFFQLLDPVMSQNLWQKISQDVEDVDKYVKKLKTVQLVQLVINAEMRQYSSLAEISNSLSEEAFAKAIHLESISTSQISRRFREMSTDVANIIHKSVVQTLGLRLGFNALRQSLGRLYLIDASTITLCLSQYLWADFRTTNEELQAFITKHQITPRQIQGRALRGEDRLTVAVKPQENMNEIVQKQIEPATFVGYIDMYAILDSKQLSQLEADPLTLLVDTSGDSYFTGSDKEFPHALSWLLEDLK